MREIDVSVHRKTRRHIAGKAGQVSALLRHVDDVALFGDEGGQPFDRVANLPEQDEPELREDRDITWMVHPGAVWWNAGIMVRFSSTSAARRLDALIDRYRRHRRGMTLWISPSATPANISELLAARRLRCRKHYPAMIRHLGDRVTPLQECIGLLATSEGQQLYVRRGFREVARFGCWYRSFQR